MLFVDPFFLFAVLPVALIAFYGAGRFWGRTAALVVIGVTSAVFYAPYGLFPAGLLLLSLLINLLIGLALTGGHPRITPLRQALLGFGLTLNFLALGLFKYLDAGVAAFAPEAGPLLGVAIPAGISFYTFHQAVFLVDAFNRQPDLVAFLANLRGSVGAAVAGVRYSAFVAFFPQLVIGPITYMREFGPQVLGASFGRLKRADLQVGIALIVVGLFKKLCVADPLARVVDPIYGLLEAGTPISPAQASFALIGFYFQLYFDFSGYSDIALGIARLFGIRLPINFDSPLRAIGIVDFYRRWHITLTRVIALFLFTPLSLWGTRFAVERGLKGWQRRALASWLPMLVNFQVIALWHAAKSTFVVFGLVHGLWYVLESEIRSSRRFKAFRARTSERTRFLLGLAITVFPLMLTFALFRCESLAGFGALLKGLVAFGTPAPQAGVKAVHWQILLGAGAIIYLLPNVMEWLRHYRPGIVTFVNPPSGLPWLRFAFRPTLFWALFLFGLWVFVFVNLNRPSPFLYAGF